jgi:hypothetical protein
MLDATEISLAVIMRDRDLIAEMRRRVADDRPSSSNLTAWRTHSIFEGGVSNMLRSHRDDLELLAGAETGWEVPSFPDNDGSGVCQECLGAIVPWNFLKSIVVFPSSKSSGGI